MIINSYFFRGPIQEVESLLHQLSAEQQEVDLLRAAVAQEKEDVARETEHVATLAKVSCPEFTISKWMIY